MRDLEFDLIILAHIAAGAPVKPTREMALEAILEIISLQSECVRLREENERLKADVAIEAKIADAAVIMWAAGQCRQAVARLGSSYIESWGSLSASAKKVERKRGLIQ